MLFSFGDVVVDTLISLIIPQVVKDFVKTAGVDEAYIFLIRDFGGPLSPVYFPITGSGWRACVPQETRRGRNCHLTFGQIHR